MMIIIINNFMMMIRCNKITTTYKQTIKLHKKKVVGMEKR